MMDLAEQFFEYPVVKAKEIRGSSAFIINDDYFMNKQHGPVTLQS